MRVRGFTQDDGHIFCTEDQILTECVNFTTLLQKVYKDFGFTDIIYKIATRPAQRIGSDESWDRAEEALMQSLKASGCDYILSPGDGAFYGPKIEYTLKDAIGRQWQCGTIQLDFSMPDRLGAEYVADDNARRIPVMLHRAILGSLERFIGILIEQGIIRFLYGRPLETLLATWGLSLVLQQAVRTAFGPTNREVGNPSWMSGAFEIGQINIAYGRLWIIVFTMGVFVGLLMLLRFSQMNFLR